MWKSEESRPNTVARENAIKRGAAGISGSPLGLSWWRSGSLRSVRVLVVDVEGFRSR